MESLNTLRDEAYRTAREHGWWDPQVVCLDESHNEVMAPRTLGELLMLVVSEAAEALEEVRNGHHPNELYWQHPDGQICQGSSPCNGDPAAKPEGVPAELADIIIRVLDMCGHYGIDIEEAVTVKMVYNDSRPYRHGGKAL